MYASHTAVQESSFLKERWDFANSGYRIIVLDLTSKHTISAMGTSFMYRADPTFPRMKRTTGATHSDVTLYVFLRYVQKKFKNQTTNIYFLLY